MRFRRNNFHKIFINATVVAVALLGFLSSSAHAWQIKKYDSNYEDTHTFPFCAIENRYEEMGLTLFIAKSIGEKEKMLIGFRQGLLKEDKNYKITLSLETKGQQPKLVKAVTSALDKDLLELSLLEAGLDIDTLLSYQRMNIIGFGDTVTIDFVPAELEQGVTDLEACMEAIQLEYSKYKAKVDDEIAQKEAQMERDRLYVNAVQQVLDYANIPYREIEDKRIEDVLLRRSGVITWKSKYLLGAVRLLPFSHENGFRAAAETYLNEFRKICPNGFVNDIGQNETQGSLTFIRSDIACARDKSDHLLSVLFVKKEKNAIAFLQEGRMTQATEVIAVRNDLLKAFQKIADSQP